jgi:hypothetical protein
LDNIEELERRNSAVSGVGGIAPGSHWQEGLYTALNDILAQMICDQCRAVIRIAGERLDATFAPHQEKTITKGPTPEMVSFIKDSREWLGQRSAPADGLRLTVQPPLGDLTK